MGVREGREGEKGGEGREGREVDRGTSCVRTPNEGCREEDTLPTSHTSLVN